MKRGQIKVVSVGDQRVPVAAIKSIESCVVPKPLPGTPYGAIALFACAIGAALAASTHIWIVAIPLSLGILTCALWVLVPGARIYGWLVHFHDRPTMAVRFDSLIDAEQFRGCLLRVAPQIQVTHATV